MNSSNKKNNHHADIKRRLFLKRFPRYALLFALIAGAVWYSLDYLSKLPRERFAKGYNYFERVWLGTKKATRMTALSMKAIHEDPKGTKLPIVEIYIKGKRIDKLNEHLPESGTHYQKAKVKIGGKGYSADVRYRGDSMNHWAFPNKSWRVRLRKGKFYDGMQSFNLNVPRVDTQISNWLGYKMAEKFPDLLVPEASFVHFRLNRQFDGVRLFLEQPNQDFLARRGLPYGKLYIGDIDSPQIYGGVKRKHLYKDYTAWQVRSPDVHVAPKEMQQLISLIKDQQPNPYTFSQEMEDLFDMPALLQYMALLELVGTVHIDETHNGKYYFDPVRGKFVPIVWDTVAYMWHNNQPIDLGTNSLFRVVLSNPEFRERKDRYLWKALKEELPVQELHTLIDSEKQKLRKDIYAFGLKIHANDKGVKHISNEEWEDSLLKLKSSIKTRHNQIESELSHASLMYSLEREKNSRNTFLLALRNNARPAVKLQRVALPLIGGAPSTSSEITLERVGLPSEVGKQKPITGVVHGGSVHFVLSDRLYSKRSFRKSRNGALVPATYFYRITIPDKGAVGADLRIKANNALTGKKISEIKRLETPAELSKKPYAVWWDMPLLSDKSQSRTISGDVKVDNTIHVPAGEKLVIAPGTTLRFAPGASLHVRGGTLLAEGTETKPIHFLPQSENWGVIALNNPKKAELNNIQVVGTTSAMIDNVRYEGMLNLYHGVGSVSNSSFRGGYLSAKYSELTLKGVVVESPFPFSLVTDNAFVKEQDLKKMDSPLVHKVSLLDEKGFGTPTRTEREFKWSISSDNELTLEDTAEKIRLALSESSGSDDWQAPKYTGNNFYVDESYADFVFRDVYFDTPDALNYKNQISYRLRNRYKSLNSYKRHVKHQDWPPAWPYRLEFQAKTGRKELGRGFSTVEEARFEFRKESTPFSAENLPPRAPWDLDEFIPYFATGYYKGWPTYPAIAIMTTLKDQLGGKQELEVKPELVLLTERFRMHLNMKSPWGSGPNPEQSYIISLDKSEVYPSGPYLNYLKSRKQGLKPSAPPSAGSIMEIEIEFERNVSDVLDKRIEAARSANDSSKLKELITAREAFLADQETIMKVVQRSFREQGLDLQPASKSKYVQAYEILNY